MTKHATIMNDEQATSTSTANVVTGCLVEQASDSAKENSVFKTLLYTFALPCAKPVKMLMSNWLIQSLLHC